jgi:hypothetical protein
MDRELWKTLSHAMFDVARAFPKSPRQTHDIHRIVRVYLWAVLHDRPVLWATRGRNWPRANRPKHLPGQSTMSRRLRLAETSLFLTMLARRVAGTPQPVLIKAIDGKPLVIPKHSTDPDAGYGRGVGGMAKGYKLHAICDGSAMPLAWSVQPLNVSELNQADKLVEQLEDEGYILADCSYDSNKLHDTAMDHGHQMIAPRRTPGAGLAHVKQSVHRLRSIHLLEQSPSPFGCNLYKRRREIERQFGGMVSFGGGLQSLPAWVRTLRRVPVATGSELPALH